MFRVPRKGRGSATLTTELRLSISVNCAARVEFKSRPRFMASGKKLPGSVEAKLPNSKWFYFNYGMCLLRCVKPNRNMYLSRNLWICAAVGRRKRFKSHTQVIKIIAIDVSQAKLCVCEKLRKIANDGISRTPSNIMIAVEKISLSVRQRAAERDR